MPPEISHISCIGRIRDPVNGRRFVALIRPPPRDLPARRGDPQSASVPASPVRMRNTASTGTIQTLPSPILPVRAASMSRVDDPFGVAVVDEDLDPHLRHEVDRVLRAPVHLGVPALAAEALHLA